MNQFEIPKTFKAAQLPEHGKELQLVELETPTLKEGEVLIKVEAAPVNPSDLQALVGHYPHGKTLPAVFGFEGSGVIVQLHESVQNVKLGTRVSFSVRSQYGSYGQYALTSSYSVIPLDDDVSFEAGASAIVNPVTVLTMLEEAKERGAKAVVHTAAASALGRMFVKYFQDNGINVINIVRREEQVQLLTKEGAKYVLNSSTPTFFQDLNKLSTELEATVFYDAIGGNLTGQILQQLPNNSTVYVYGLLSGQDISNVTISDLLFKGKTVKGFWLQNHIHKYNPFADPNARQKLNDLLKTSLKTEYANQYSLEKINEGIAFYKQNQTASKILVRPNQ